jgi:hypothetical protein
MSKKVQSALITFCFCLVATFASLSPVQVDAASRTSRSSVASVVHKAAMSKKSVKKAQASSKSIKTVTKELCVIKGNISSKKEKIYHLPGCPNYGQTIIEVGAGEMMFCSEAEATKAGWRKSGNCPK